MSAKVYKNKVSVLITFINIESVRCNPIPMTEFAKMRKIVKVRICGQPLFTNIEFLSGTKRRRPHLDPPPVNVPKISRIQRWVSE